MIRSTDGGLTWSAEYDCLGQQPARADSTRRRPAALCRQGPVAAGRAGRRLRIDRRRPNLEVARPTSHPATATTHADYHELHAVETSDGRIVVQIRNHNRPTRAKRCNANRKTAARPGPSRSRSASGVCRRTCSSSDGRLLMSYGHRREPLGNQARLSTDQCRTWSEPIILCGDGAGDLGYPSTVELADGTLLTVWYDEQGVKNRDLAASAVAAEGLSRRHTPCAVMIRCRPWPSKVHCADEGHFAARRRNAAPPGGRGSELGRVQSRRAADPVRQVLSLSRAGCRPGS